MISLALLLVGALVLVPEDVAGIDGDGLTLVGMGALYSALGALSFALRDLFYLRCVAILSSGTNGNGGDGSGGAGGRGGAVVVRVPSHCEGRVFDPGFRPVPHPSRLGKARYELDQERGLK